jgi:hypothetical protein
LALRYLTAKSSKSTDRNQGESVSSGNKPFLFHRVVTLVASDSRQANITTEGMLLLKWARTRALEIEMSTSVMSTCQRVPPRIAKVLNCAAVAVSHS